MTEQVTTAVCRPDWTWRRLAAVTVDVALAVGLAVSVAVSAYRGPLSGHTVLAELLAVAVLVVCSLVQRVLLQRIAGATVGQAAFGLCVVRRSDAQRPDLGELVRGWLYSVGVGTAHGIAIVTAADLPVTDGARWEIVPAVVRRGVGCTPS